MDRKNILIIEKLLNTKIIYSKLLSDSFGINCFKFTTSNNHSFIVKYYKKSKQDFNALEAEGKNLLYLKNLNLNFFPKVIINNSKYLIMSYLENNGIQPNLTNEDLLKVITKLHSKYDIYYGYDFETQIGGLKQINKRSRNWVDFFRDFRLNYVFNLINITKPMNTSTNVRIEYILKNLENLIPKKPKASLLHGDLWEGNILFHDKKIVGLIDPGSYFGHNELEIAYLRWFNPKFIDKNFLTKYNNNIKINESYLEYEPIYQLYYSMLNVLLWDRNYIFDVERLLNKIKV